MVNIAAQINSLDQETLTLLVRRVTGSDTVEILERDVTRLGAGPTNPTSLGLYRLAGRADDRGTTVTYSLVVKVVQSPANAGWPGLGEEPSHWNYWRRELLAYQSVLLDDLPEGLVVPRFFGAAEHAGDTAWLWLEDIPAFGHASWTLDDYHVAARHLGRFHGAYLTGRPLPTHTWLNRDFHRAWSRFVREQSGDVLDRLAQPDGAFGALHELAPPAQVAAFVRCLRDPEPFLTALDRLPRTLCHYDANPYNLLVRTAGDGQDQLVAIDWQAVGLGPVGEDISQFVTTVIAVHQVQDWKQLDAHLFESYVNGLRGAGWEGDARVARAGYVLSAVLRQGFFLLFMLHRLLAQRDGDEPAQHSQPSIEAFLQKTAAVFCHLFTLADEAHHLLLTLDEALSR